MPSSRNIPTSLTRPTRSAVAKSIAALSMALLAVTACSSNSKSQASASGTTAATSAAAGSTAGTTGSAAGSGATAAAMVKTATGALGTYLVDAQGRTLYLFVADTSSASTCNGSCAQYWPPLLTSGPAQAGGQAKASLLGTTSRNDGTTQVTYKGHPLYYFALDKATGDTKGQGSNGFGAKWWLVAPDGSSITGTGKSGSSSSSGYTY